MAEKRRPTKTKIKRGGKRVSLKDKQAMGNPEISREEMIKKAKEQQKIIDDYNKSIVKNIDPYFDDVQLEDDWIIVRLFQENFIKHLDESNPDDIQVDMYIRQIDARQRNTDEPNWVPTPFPYTEQGVICAVSPSVKLKYMMLKGELEKYDKYAAKDIIIPDQGVIVNIRARHSQWFKEHRFYIDKQKQCMDFVRNQLELRLGQFEGYFILKAHDVEAYEPKRKK